VPLVLAAVTFLVYWPSLKSDFVYDAREEILTEGFISSVSNLPAILSLKVLSMNLILGDRPGQLLYMMLLAFVCGKGPFGYHVCSNLLHATNVALLFVLLRRLMAVELKEPAKSNVLKAQLAVVAVTLIFALHSVVVEPVAGVSFSSDLLVTFFTLLALLAATAFDSDQFCVSMLTGCAGTFCAFAAVACKESGMAAALLLVVYWFFFRRGEAKGPWFCFLGSAIMVTAFFLAIRFLWAPPSRIHLSYLGGSFSQVFWLQPRLWVYMMGKLLWPTQLSADYTLENMSGIATPFALSVLIVVVSLQAWLATKSRLGALGAAIYWLGLVTVSNFIPLYRISADRFYYLPLAGVAMQLLALLLLTLRARDGFWVALAPLLAALLPLTLLTLAREDVFASDLSLWRDTLQVSPLSWTAHNGLAIALFQKGRVDEAIEQYQKALEINPTIAQVHTNLGIALNEKGRVDEAIEQYQKALQIDSNLTQVHNNLGNIFFKRGQADEAITQYEMVLLIDPDHLEAHYNLGLALLQKGRFTEAMAQFQEALRLKPDFGLARNNLAKVQAIVRQGASAK